MALALCAGAGLLLTPDALAVAQTSSFTPGGPPLPQPVPSANVLNVADIMAAAAKAAGIQPQPGVEGAPAQPTETLPRPNPFATPIQGPARQNMVIPANPLDPEKVIVRDADGLISLMVREGSLRQVISMIAETQKLNIVFAGATDTLVTASFDRQPWQQVLESLLSASGHTWVTRDDVIFVAAVENAEFLPPGTDGRRVAVFDLDFASAVDIDQTIKGLLSPAGSSWLAESKSTDNRKTREVVAVLDYPQHLERISEYISQADQPPRQVYIKARILAVTLSDECRNGVNFENLARWSSANINLRSVGFANSAATNAFFVEPDGVGLDGLIELLQTTNDVKTLASPAIHAVSGQESHIQIGDKLGYRVTTTTQTSSLESVQMLEVGVVLRVTPRVTRDGRVLMRIMPKVSDGTVAPDTGLPSEKTTEIETDVMMCSGEGMLIGGLIQETDSNIQSKVPFIGDVPYLGVLFQKRSVLTSRREIIVTLEPHVLPFDPIVAAEHRHQVMRAAEPLTFGAIHSFPRPYEPQMPDALAPIKHAGPIPSHWTKEHAHPATLELLPAIEASDLQNPAAMGVVVPRRDEQLRHAEYETKATQAGPQLTR